MPPKKKDAKPADKAKKGQPTSEQEQEEVQKRTQMFVHHSVDALYAGTKVQEEIIKGVFDEIWRK